MATEAEDLAEIKANLLARIKELTASPKPNYTDPSGKTVSWQNYLDSLWDKVKEINQQINAADPFEEVSQGVT